MCGIAGIVERPGAETARSLRSMIDRLAHRGPDDCGIQCWPDCGVGVAHRRLSVIDLTAAGHQPMATPDGRYTITYNGEVYNFQDLRRELVDLGLSFRSQSDTEVVLRAYETWGLESVNRLRGMFAFAIWDRAERRMLLARDRVGLKPLYYAHAGERFAFASEPKALLAHPAISSRVDPSALLDYLTYGYVPYDASIFAGIKKLPAGHALRYADGVIEIVDYWRFNPSSNPAEPATLADLPGRLENAIGSHLVADVPIATFLSGGIDSSVVTALAARATPKIDTLTVGFDSGTSELTDAREVATMCATHHREELVAVGQVDDLIQLLVHSYDEPLADTSTVPTYLLCKTAARHSKVALSGDGGDELFAGYLRYGRMLQPRLPSRTAAAAIDVVRKLPHLWRLQVLLRDLEPDPLRRYHLHAGLFDDWETARLSGTDLNAERRGRDPLWLFRKFYHADLPFLTALQWLDLKTYLVDDILVKVDRASMAHSLEVRPPLLDHELVELAFRMPSTEQRDDFGGKALLKRAAGNVLPAGVLGRDKRGFSPPITTWFKQSLWKSARERLLKGYCHRDGVLNMRTADTLVASHTERRWAKVWALWILEEWYRRWIVGGVR